MTLNHSIEDINISHYSPTFITIFIPSSFLCLALIIIFIIYIYLHKYHKNLNENEKFKHMNILKQYINYLKEFNEKQKDQIILPSYQCQHHQNFQRNIN